MNETLVATLTVSELHNVLANALFCVAKDDSLPVLCAVKMVEHNGQVMALSTDRYRLSEVLGTAETVSPDLNALLPVALVKQVIGMLKLTPKKDASKLTVELWQGEETFTVKMVTGAIVSGAQQTGDYPKLHSLFPSEPIDERDAHGIWAVNPAYMIDMMKVKHVDGSSRNLPSRVSGGMSANKPVLVEHGGWFRGIIMPVRLPENSALNTETRF